MKTTVKKLGDSKILLTVEVSEVDMKRLLNEAARELSLRINIPGFRKGSAPRSVLEAKVGPTAIVEEFLQGGGLPNLYSRAVAESGYEPIAQPEVDMKDPPEPGKPFKFTATVEVKPDVDLTDVKKIKVKKPEVKVAEEELEHEITGLRDRFAEIQDAEAAKIENGLFAMIDFDGSVSGQPLEGGKAEDYLLEIGSNMFWPGFEEQIMGAKRGEDRKITVAVPEEYFEKSLAGKTAEFKVKVKDIKKKIVPPLDKEFAKKVGFESVEGFRKDVKDNIRRVKENQAREAFGADVVRAAAAAAKVEVPQSMTDQYTERMISSFMQQLQEVGATMEDYLATQEGLTIEKFREGVAADAAITAKSDLVLDALAKQEKIIISDPELDESINKYISSMGDEGKFFTEGPDALTNRARLRTAIKQDLLKAKAADFLLSLVDKPVKKKKAETADAADKPTAASKPAKADKPAKAGKPDKEDK
ncbi:MAG: trigger factor [Actinomycetota bacterium]